VVVAHCGVQSYRGQALMQELLHRQFEIKDLSNKVKEFIGKCLLCKHTKEESLFKDPGAQFEIQWAGMKYCILIFCILG